jgi:hypothetical protein
MNAIQQVQHRTTKYAWEPPRLAYDGDLRDLVLSGMGKLSATGGDPGEGKKQLGGKG